MAEALFEQVKVFIDTNGRKYSKAVRGGKKGGRPSIASKEDIKNVIKEAGLTSPKKLAEYFQCSERTILRKISKDEIALTWENSSSFTPEEYMEYIKECRKERRKNQP